MFRTARIRAHRIYLGSSHGVHRRGYLSALTLRRRARLFKVSLSLSGDSWPNYVRLEWESGDEEIRFPPTTHLIATVDDFTDVLNFDSKDIDDIDDDAGAEQEPPPTGRWTTTSSYDIYMVDTPKENNGGSKGCNGG